MTNPGLPHRFSALHSRLAESGERSTGWEMNAWLAYYEGKPINEQGSSERAMRRLQSGGTQSESKPHTPMSRQEIEDRIAAISKGLMSVTPDYRQNNWNHTRSQLLELASLREALMQLDGCYVGGAYYQAASGQPARASSIA